MLVTGVFRIWIPRENRGCLCCCWLVSKWNRTVIGWGERVSTRWERRSADVQSGQECTRHIPTQQPSLVGGIILCTHVSENVDSTYARILCRFETICCLHHTLTEQMETTADFLRLLCNNGIFRCWCLVWSNLVCLVLAVVLDSWRVDLVSRLNEVEIPINNGTCLLLQSHFNVGSQHWLQELPVLLITEEQIFRLTYSKLCVVSIQS